MTYRWTQLRFRTVVFAKEELLKYHQKECVLQTRTIVFTLALPDRTHLKMTKNY